MYIVLAKAGHQSGGNHLDSFYDVDEEISSALREGDPDHARLVLKRSEHLLSHKDRKRFLCTIRDAEPERKDPSA